MRKYIIIGSIVVVLVIARLMLPYFVTRFVNKVLADIPGYTGSISDVDIHLIRGAYVIKELKLFKVDGVEKIPFIDIPSTDLSIEWDAIFKGSVVGEVIFSNPKVNFIGGDKKDGEGNTTNQTGEDVDWTVPIKRLMPLQINRLEIENGSVFFFDFTTKPQVDIHLKQLHLLATNLNNVDEQSDALPSKITATAISIGNGQLTIDMDINVLKEIPDLDLDMKFESINMPALNDFFLAYAKVDVEKGVFNVYSELAIDDGMIAGYVKPLALDVKIVSWENDKQKPLNLIWQSIVGFFVEVFSNQKKDQFATKVEIEGDLNNPETKVWPTVWNVYKNAFVKAFEMNTDNNIKFTPRKIEETRKEKRQRERSEKKEEGD
ncbi:MAG TPA: DUF748 domain-containing protein [Chryseolinea sp.]|nr:DUF748 domain-containing protein [Chryseolinea sp.]HPM31015.1 DUF748 domain-containing protein [Chryseolinea sp.]